MDMNELKITLPNCPRCGRHCPIDAVSCPRGQELVEKILSGDMTVEEAANRSGEAHEGHRHEGHGPRGEGQHEGGRHHHRKGEETGEGDEEGHHCRHRSIEDGHGFPPPPPPGEGRGPHHEHHGHRPPFPPDDDSLMALFHHCMHRLRHGGSAFGQKRVLQLLVEEDLPQRELQNRLGIQPASLSELIGKLEAKGLIIQERNDLDRRRAVIRLTDQGRTTIAEPEKEDPFFMLTEEEQTQLKALLKKTLEQGN